MDEISRYCWVSHNGFVKWIQLDLVLPISTATRNATNRDRPHDHQAFSAAQQFKMPDLSVLQPDKKDESKNAGTNLEIAVTSQELSAKEPQAAKSLPRKKRISKAFTTRQKIQFVDLFRQEQQPVQSQRMFARKHRLSHARFSAWCREYDQMKSVDLAKQSVTRIRSARARFPQLEARVSEWMQRQPPLTNIVQEAKRIKLFARQAAAELGLLNFQGSTSWLERFRKRFNSHAQQQETPASAGSDAILDLMLPEEIPIVRCDDSFTTEIEDRLIDEVLQKFLGGNESFLSPLEMAGIGLSGAPPPWPFSFSKLDSIEFEDDELDIVPSTKQVVLGKPPLPRVKNVRNQYTASQRKKYVELFRTEQKAAGGKYSLRRFCQRYKVSRSRMAVWIRDYDILAGAEKPVRRKRTKASVVQETVVNSAGGKIRQFHNLGFF